MKFVVWSPRTGIGVSATTMALAIHSAMNERRETLLFQPFPQEVDTSPEQAFQVGSKGINLVKTYVNDDGVDAVLRRAESYVLERDQFDAAAIQVLDEYLYVLPATKNKNTANFCRSMTMSLAEIIEAAGKNYDNVFVDLSEAPKESYESAMNAADVIVACVDQSPMTIRLVKKYIGELPKKTQNKVVYLCCNYHSDSAFTVMSVASDLNIRTKNLCFLPHNGEFGDCYGGWTLKKFFMRNQYMTIKDTETNFSFIAALEQIYQFIIRERG